MNASVYGSLQVPHFVDTLAVLAALGAVNVVIFGVLRHWTSRASIPDDQASSWQLVGRRVSTPVHLVVLIAGINVALVALTMRMTGELTVRRPD